MLLILASVSVAQPTLVPWAPVPVGTEVRSQHETELSLDLVAGPIWHRVDVELGKTHAQTVEMTVLAIDEGGPTRFSATWTRNHLADHGPDGERVGDLPVLGHTYELTPGGPVDAPAEEAAIAAQQADFFRLLEALHRMVDAPLEPGASVPTGPEFAGLVRDAPGEPTVSGTLTANAPGVFDLDLRVQSDGALRPGVHVTIDARLTGRMVLDVETGWTELLDVSGPVDVSGTALRDGRSHPLGGSGTFRSTTRLAYQ